MRNEWRSFRGGAWETEINVRDFIQKNYHPYDGDSSFLEGPTQDTTDLWEQVLELSKQEYQNHLHDYFPRTGVFKQRKRKNRRIPDRQAFQTFLTAIWRYSYGNESLRG